jgi:hypothetical protein
MSLADNRNDRKFLLYFSAAMVVLVAIVCLAAPASNQQDAQPTTYNDASAGTKAAFLTLQALIPNTQRWDRPTRDIATLDAAHTTLIFTQPLLTQHEEKPFAADLKQFLDRGGRVLLTDADGDLLPNGETARPNLFLKGLCYTTPEGPGPLARAGSVEISEHQRWSADGPLFRVAQRCGKDAVVVRFPVGQGEAIWWSSSTPLSNAGLKSDANLKLLLASIGANRTILFDEYTHTYRQTEDPTKGLPLGWLELQAAILFLLLILSFSRRKGPLRFPVTLPRSSPVEFADSMGNLYAKAGATTTATTAAERRFHRFLHREAGIARATIDRGPEAIAEALQARLSGDWSDVTDHLTQIATITTTEVSPRTALKLIQAIDEDETRIRKALRPPPTEPLTDLTTPT